LDHDIGPAIAHFLNCFVGKVLGASTKGSLSNAQSKTLKVCLPKLGNLVVLISAANTTVEFCDVAVSPFFYLILGS
jgi:hypothetical protein